MNVTETFTQVLHEWGKVFMQRSVHDFKCFMDGSGLSMPQVNTMMRLHYGGPCGVSDIADHLGVTNAAASQMIERLVQQGLLSRTEKLDDRRIKQIELTEKGKDLIEAGIEARQQWVDELSQTLSLEQREAITTAMKLLIDAARSSMDEEQHHSLFRPHPGG